ncbi:MAG: hypothetical protein R3288_03290 [Woeseiaceae bacterium]|nr:hypothetical protein [Woeseiaceae bacterium]
MTIARTVFAVFLAMLLPAAHACDYPERADIPNGGSATKEQMLEGQRSVKAFMAAMEEYLDCIEAEEARTIESMPDISEEERANRQAALTKKHNAAVDDMELVAARFNEAVRAYKAQGE